MGSDAHGRRHPTPAWLKAGREAADGSTKLISGRKLVVQIVETFGEKMKPNFVETLDSVAMAKELKFDLVPVTLYGADVTLLPLNLCLETLDGVRNHSWRRPAPSTPEGEARQADDIERHYRSLFGHPAVESITYWGFTDAGAWLGAPSGLVRVDGSPKPSYGVLDRLIRDAWWTAPTRVRTDDAATQPGCHRHHLPVAGLPDDGGSPFDIDDPVLNFGAGRSADCAAMPLDQLIIVEDSAD